MKLKSSDITPEAIYLDRRSFMVGAIARGAWQARNEVVSSESQMPAASWTQHSVQMQPLRSSKTRR